MNFEGQPAGTYSFRYTTNTAQAPCVDETLVVDITVTDCDVDTDGDGLLDGLEATLGTNPTLADTDGDGIDDGVEVGPDTANPLDEDSDGIIDALDSNTEDADLDGVNDQQDPANLNPCVPNPDNDNCIADLGVTKTADVAQAVLGQEIVFTITLDNFSPIPMQSIEVGDLLESGFEFVSATATVGSYDNATGIWTVDNIAASSSETLEITVNVINGDSYSNTAELLTSDPVDGNPDNDTSTLTVEIVIPADADISVNKVAQITPGGAFQEDRLAPLVGDRIRFIVSVTNESADATVSDIQVLDLLNPESDTGFEYVQHTYVQGTFPAGAYNPDTGLWNIENLDPGETVQLSIVAFVRRAGEFVNTARILSPAADADPSNNEDDVVVVVSGRNDGDPLYNQFSPNGDNINDDLKIQLVRTNPATGQPEEVINSYSIQIFNRYGQLMLDVSNRTTEVIWDGTFKNEQAPEGTYFYVLQYERQLETDVEQVTNKGWIQLIR